MNFLDILIIIVVAVLVITGFFGGMGRVAACFFAIYFATVISAAFYDSVGEVFYNGIGHLGESTAKLSAFLLLFALLTAGFYWVIWQTLHSFARKRSKFPILDNMGGAALAIVVGMLTIAMTLSVAVILLGALSQSSSDGETGAHGVLGHQIRDSELAPMFLKLQPTVTSAMEPWFPSGLPEILRTPPEV